MHKHSDYFQYFVFTDSVNQLVHLYFHIVVDHFLKVELLDQNANIYNFVAPCQIPFKEDYTDLHSHQQCIIHTSSILLKFGGIFFLPQMILKFLKE